MQITTPEKADIIWHYAYDKVLQCLAWWRNCYGIGHVTKRSQVRLPIIPPSANNSEAARCSHTVPL